MRTEIISENNGKAKMKQKEKNSLEPGMELVITRWVGLQGTALAAKSREAELLRRFPASMVLEAQSFARFLDTREDEAAAIQEGARAVYRLGSQGVLSGLWNAAEASGVGLQAELRRIPIRQETVEICEYFQINPYYLLSGGSLLLGAADGYGLAARLSRRGIPAATIGQADSGNDRILYNQGIRRYLDRPKTDEIYKCGDRLTERRESDE